MLRAFRWALVLGMGAGIVWALCGWPRLNRVETGRTSEYPDLQPRRYAARPDVVAAAVWQAAKALPHWELWGAGSGPAGAELRLAHVDTPLPLREEILVRVSTEAGTTLVSVRSESAFGPLDFGQNARNVRALLAAVDARVR
jgi:hypothetical protein